MKSLRHLVRMPCGYLPTLRRRSTGGLPRTRWWDYIPRLGTPWNPPRSTRQCSRDPTPDKLQMDDVLIDTGIYTWQWNNPASGAMQIKWQFVCLFGLRKAIFSNQETTLMEFLRKVHPQFSRTDYESCITVTSTDSWAIEHLVSISFGASVCCRDGIDSGKSHELRWLSLRMCSADMVLLVRI